MAVLVQGHEGDLSSSERYVARSTGPATVTRFSCVLGVVMPAHK